jgi:hypothetical protein
MIFSHFEAIFKTFYAKYFSIKIDVKKKLFTSSCSTNCFYQESPWFYEVLTNKCTCIYIVFLLFCFEQVHFDILSLHWL